MSLVSTTHLCIFAAGTWYCSVLQCVAVCCSEVLVGWHLQHVCLDCTSNTRQTTQQHTATHTTHCNTLQHTATHCNTLQHTSTQCITPQHATTHCNTHNTCVSIARQMSAIRSHVTFYRRERERRGREEGRECVCARERRGREGGRECV